MEGPKQKQWMGLSCVSSANSKIHHWENSHRFSHSHWRAAHYLTGGPRATGWASSLLTFGEVISIQWPQDKIVTQPYSLWRVIDRHVSHVAVVQPSQQTRVKHGYPIRHKLAFLDKRCDIPRSFPLPSSVKNYLLDGYGWLLIPTSYTNYMLEITATCK